MFLACRVPKLAFRKVPKTSLFTVFCTPTEDKTTLCAMFSYSQYPKMKPKQWYLRCFCNSEKGVFGECRKTKSNIRMAKIQKRCILRCFFPFRCENFCFEKRSKHRNLQVEPGKPGAEVSKKKNYKSKKVFAYRMCTG